MQKRKRLSHRNGRVYARAMGPEPAGATAAEAGLPPEAPKIRGPYAPPLHPAVRSVLDVSREFDESTRARIVLGVLVACYPEAA